MMGNNRPPERSGHVVAVKGCVIVGELSSRPELLTVEVIARGPVKSIRTGSGGHHHLNRTGATVIYGKRIRLNGCFLNCIGVRNEIEGALLVVARYV